jgi:hypothetical protein
MGIIRRAQVHDHPLTPSRLAHHQADQVVNQGEDDELFEDPVDGFALQHIEAHGGFQMREIGFNAPPGIVDIIANNPIDQKVVELSFSQHYSLVEHSM